MVKTVVRMVVLLLIVLVLFPLLPLIISGRWDWWQAWVQVGLADGVFILSRILAGRKHTGLIKERAESPNKKDTKRWDRILAPLMAFGTVLPLVVAGFDKRFGWTEPFGLTVSLIAMFLIILAYTGGTLAFLENRFFSGVIRIQKDRGHEVISSGPYAIVRHPGYATSLISLISYAVFFDSLIAILSTVPIIIVTFLRTAYEDITLTEELPGYREYKEKTRFRLIPGIW